MNDPRGPRPYNSSPDTPTNRSRAGMAETLQQALRSLGSDRAGLGGSGTLTPDQLIELARRAGLNSPQQIAELSQMIGITADANADAANMPQHVLFALADVECALPTEAVQGVERISEITPVPNTVPWVLGIVHLHGAILSAVDLRGFFGMPGQPLTQRSRLLVVTKREMTIGLVVDGVTEMRSLENELQQAASSITPPGWVAPYAQQVINVEGRAVIALDPERILYADKMHRYRSEFA